MFQLLCLNNLTFRFNIHTGATWYLAVDNWILVKEEANNEDGGEEEDV